MTTDITIEHILANAVPVPGIIRGVYFLIREGEIVYIGQCQNLYHRVGWHLTAKKVDSWFFLPHDGTNKELSTLERRLIVKFQPRLNTQKSTYSTVAYHGPGRPRKATLDAIALVNQGYTPYAAAKESGIAIGTIYLAIGKAAPRKRALIRRGTPAANINR